MVPIKNRISDVLMAGESRPFDAVLKDIFKKPRVLKNFAATYLRRNFRIADRGYFDFEDDAPTEFLNDEFRPNQDTWHADLSIARPSRALEDVKTTFSRG